MRSERIIEHSFEQLVPLFFCLMNELYSELETLSENATSFDRCHLMPDQKDGNFFLDHMKK
jgi:hypothetical protein